MGCSRQNLSYWENHSYSIQYRKSIYRVVYKAGAAFQMQQQEMERLANRAGLSLAEHENGLSEVRKGYTGLLKTLYESAQISERMFRLYKTKEPTKQALLAIAVSQGMSFAETEGLLRKYGYCLSKSLAADMVVYWYLTVKHHAGGMELLAEINETLYDMGFPLLMTRQNREGT